MCVQVHPAAAEHRRGADQSGAQGRARHHPVPPGAGAAGLPPLTGVVTLTSFLCIKSFGKLEVECLNFKLVICCKLLYQLFLPQNRDTTGIVFEY